VQVLYKTILDCKTRILVDGEGEAVVLIHGVGMLAERWLQNIEVLGKRYAVYAPDLLSHGFSDNYDFGNRAPQIVHLQQIVSMLDVLGIEKCVVVGSSYGGLIATLLALNYPHRVKKLVIVGSGSATHVPDRQPEVLAAAKANAMNALRDGTLAGCIKRAQNTVFDPTKVPTDSLYMLLNANALPGRLAATEAFFDKMIAHARDPECVAYNRLEQLKMPVLIITGREDIRASWQAAAAAQQRIPQCEIRIFEQCGHGPMVEHAEAFNKEVLAFCAAV